MNEYLKGKANEMTAEEIAHMLWKFERLNEENEQMAEKIDELEKENQCLRDANAINPYSIQMLHVRINKLEKEKQSLQYKVEMYEKSLKEYENLIGAIANIDGAFITSEGECDFTDKQALDKIMEWVDPIWEKITQRKRGVSE